MPSRACWSGVSPGLRGRNVRLYLVRRSFDRLGTILTVAAVIIAIIPLGAMLYYIIEQGGSSINIDFFTHYPVPAGESGGGMYNAIVGTLYLIAFTSIIGIPIGILSGIYLMRSTHTGFTRVVRFLTDVVAGTPSIVAGIVAYALIVIPMARFSAFSAAVALALLMFPTVTRATEEALRLVPTAIREAGLALGLPEWKTMLRIVLPAAGPGIVTAIMLGIARVAGETAPLIFTAFGTNGLPGSPLGLVEGLPYQIWVYASGPYTDWHQQAWAGAFVLFAMVVLLNIAGRLLTYRMTKRISAA